MGIQIFNPDNCANDLTLLIQSAPQFAGINVKQYRKLRLQQNVDWMTLVNTPNSSGKAGAGVIILEPYARSNEIGVSGAVFDWIFPVVSMELPAVNDDGQVGLGITAFRLAQMAIDVVHIHADDLYGTMNVDRESIEDEEKFTLPGCIGRRTNFHIVGKSLKTPLVQTIKIAQFNNKINLSTLTNGASIYYTLDGTFPASSTGINPSTLLYSVPFTVSAGTQIRACGYLANMNPSECRSLTAN